MRVLQQQQQPRHISKAAQQNMMLCHLLLVSWPNVAEQLVAGPLPEGSGGPVMMLHGGRHLCQSSAEHYYSCTPADGRLAARH